MPNPGKQLVENIRKQDISENEKIYVYGNIPTASNIWIHSENQFEVVTMNTVYTMPDEANHLIVFSEKEKPFLNLQNYDIYPGSEEWLRVPVGKFAE